MNYIIMGLLMSIGWQVARVVFEVAAELLFERLHRAKWYKIAAGVEPKAIDNSEDRPGEPKAVKERIGFM